MEFCANFDKCMKEEIYQNLYKDFDRIKEFEELKSKNFDAKALAYLFNISHHTFAEKLKFLENPQQYKNVQVESPIIIKPIIVERALRLDEDMPFLHRRRFDDLRRSPFDDLRRSPLDEFDYIS